MHSASRPSVGLAHSASLPPFDSIPSELFGTLGANTTEAADDAVPLGGSFDLAALGWNEAFAASFDALASPDLIPARVAVAYGAAFRLIAASGELDATLSGALRHRADRQATVPVVGDWVAVRPHAPGIGTIQDVLARRSAISRQAAGTATAEQVLAANVDWVLLLTGLDRDFNPRRLERALVLAWESGAQPVVVLTKADVAADGPQALRDVERIAPGVPVHLVSSLTGAGIQSLAPYLRPGQTLVLLGPSGAGKSTLTNRLVGRDVLRTGAVRVHDGRGRHTTTRQELLLLPGGGAVIDTAGLREMQLWGTGAGRSAAFEDVEAWAAGCRFGDCTHVHEPGCAVRAAVSVGQLTPERLGHYLKLGRELARQARRLDTTAQQDQKQRTKVIHKHQRNYRPRE